MSFLLPALIGAGGSALSSAISGDNGIGNTGAALYEQYMPQLIARLNTLATGQNPYITQQENAARGNNAAQVQGQYQMAGAALNGRGLYGKSNVPASMMSQEANANIANTGAIEENYAGLQSQSQAQALQQLMSALSGAGGMALSGYGGAGGMGYNQQTMTNQGLAGAGNFFATNILPMLQNGGGGFGLGGGMNMGTGGAVAQPGGQLQD